MSVTAAPLRRCDIVADMATIVHQKGRIDSMAKTSDADNRFVWRDEPAMRARNPAISKIESMLLIKEVLNVLLEIVTGKCIELCTTWVALLEVIEHRQERESVARRRRDDSDCHLVRANVEGNRRAAPMFVNEKPCIGASG